MKYTHCAIQDCGGGTRLVSPREITWYITSITALVMDLNTADPSRPTLASGIQIHDQGLGHDQDQLYLIARFLGVPSWNHTPRQQTPCDFRKEHIPLLR